MELRIKLPTSKPNLSKKIQKITTLIAEFRDYIEEHKEVSSEILKNMFNAILSLNLEKDEELAFVEALMACNKDESTNQGKFAKLMSSFVLSAVILFEIEKDEEEKEESNDDDCDHEDCEIDPKEAKEMLNRLKSMLEKLENK